MNRLIRFAAALLGASLLALDSGATYLTRIEGWESTSDDVLEFPKPAGLTLLIDGSGGLTFLRGTSSLSVMLADDGSGPGGSGWELASELERFVAQMGCARKLAGQGTLTNGWDSAWAELECRGREGKPLPGALAVSAVEGRLYLFSGVGFSLAEVRSLVESGRQIPIERRPTPSDRTRMAEEGRAFAEKVDELSGGPRRRTLLLALGVGISVLLGSLLLRRI